jgi:hypothetical protein
MITAGYISGPFGSPSAQTIVFDPTSSGSDVNASVVLSTVYWPAAYAWVPRASFLNGVPYSVNPGTSLTLPKGECAALVTAGAAKYI